MNKKMDAHTEFNLTALFAAYEQLQNIHELSAEETGKALADIWHVLSSSF